jgi:hypothetical protein
MKKPSAKIKKSGVAGLTLALYAKAKSLEIGFLQKLGLSDTVFGGKPAVKIPYKDTEGAEKAVRFRVGMKGERFRWKSGAKPCLYGLWRLKEIHAVGYAVIDEGESDLHTLWFHGFPALGLPGASSWREEWAVHLASLKKIYVVVEPDKGGEVVLKRFSKSIVRDRVWLVRLGAAKDPSGLCLKDPRNFRQNFKKALRLATRLSEATRPPVEEAETDDSPERVSQASQLIKIANSAELFHCDDKAYAAIPVNAHRENWPVYSTRFKHWLGRMFYEAEKVVPRAQALQDALNVIAGRALYAGEERAVFTRVGERNGNIYLDLGDPAWRAIEITSDGWKLINEPPVCFRRARAMAAFPEPVRGGNLDELWPFINAKSQADKILIAAWLVTSLRARGPYPILGLHGEQGTGKTTAERVLRSLVDPNSASMRSTPREIRDLMISATNSHVIALDNLSHLPVWLSDALCRLATGGGFSTRELRSDADEIIFDAMKPILLNGIGEITSRPDLMERTVLLTLSPIPRRQRLPEEEFWPLFEEARPRILGVLIDAVSTALRDINMVNLTELPRMADFAKWSTAAEETLGFVPGSFEWAYEQNIADANSVVLETSPVAACLRSFLSSDDCTRDADLRAVWDGTATELLEQLNSHRNFQTHASDSWPKSAAGLSNALRRMAPNLRAIGIVIEFRRKPGTGEKLIKMVKA